MKWLLITLAIGLAVTTLVHQLANGAALSDAFTETPDTSDETPDSTNETPDTTNETPDSAAETPDSSTETPDTPDTPETAEETPDSADTPDTKGQIPNSHGTGTVDVEPMASDDTDSESGFESGDNEPSKTIIKVSAKKANPEKREHKKTVVSGKKTSKPREEKERSKKGSKKQFLGYPEPDGRQTTVQGTYGQGGLPAPGYGGGMGNGGLGSEMEGMPVGMGGGGEPLGFKDQDSPNFHVPGIASRPSSYDENAEAGRGDNDDNEYSSRFAKQYDLDSFNEGGFSRLRGGDRDREEESNLSQRDEDVEPDESVTKAIGRPFEPDNNQEEQMDNHEDSPFQQVRQENPFQVPLNSLAAQVNFANQQMSPLRPGYGGDGPLGRQQEEMPSSRLHPQEDEGEEEQGNEQREDSNFRATSMNGGAALMGMNDQEGSKRQELGRKGRKNHLKALKRKAVLATKHGKAKKSAN